MGIQDRDYYWEHRDKLERQQPTITPSKRTEPFVKRSKAILFVLISSVSVAVITFFTTLLIAMDNPRLLTPAIELIIFLQEFLS